VPHCLNRHLHVGQLVERDSVLLPGLVEEGVELLTAAGAREELAKRAQDDAFMVMPVAKA
jgi:hypothetical protein